MELIPNRTGKATEYKRGHTYMTVVEWEDGHCEIEVHKCVPELLFHSCDKKELELAKEKFIQSFNDEKEEIVEKMDARKMLGVIVERVNINERS
jgi:hypothetical protein